MAIQDGALIHFYFTTSEKYEIITKDDNAFYYLTDTDEVCIGTHRLKMRSTDQLSITDAPLNPTDAVNKEYVDNLIEQILGKSLVVVARAGVWQGDVQANIDLPAQATVEEVVS